MAHTTVADPPQSVEPTNSLEETNTPDEHVASEENALAVTQPAESAVAEGAPKKKKIIRKKRRPARIQVDPATVKSEPPPQTGTVFNICDYRDDMGGVGSFMRQNRTLYVGRIHVTDDIEEVVARHFAEWGEIERIRVLTSRGVAFVTYTTLAQAEFAKEAMAHQSLDNNEILNVRWATVDPNPLAQKREARRLEEQAAEAVRRALPADFVAELEGRDPEARKRKKIEGSFGLQGYEPPDEVWYSRTKQLEDAGNGDQGQLEAPNQPLMLENASSASAPPQESESSGIFSSSTVAALRGLAGGNVTTQAAPQASGGPLVGYGSDDESD
ncbi:unnamed protein product [Aspergillus oryzae]|uniref:Pre-mRNA-splicing factor CWC2 n=1 Tax=Aspergillus oryzae TaxID=5062 RepID=A0AAN4Y8R8_ASPOZ|nr:unnamed protein product [Aspergillus oryzae]GMG23187.1 unnamed protein product [Aspergillus oryzae]